MKITGVGAYWVANYMLFTEPLLGLHPSGPWLSLDLTGALVNSTHQLILPPTLVTFAWFKFTSKLLCTDGMSLSRDSTEQRSQLEKLLVSYLFAGSLLSASKCCHSLDGENTVLVRFGQLLCHIWFENQVLLLLFRGSVDHLQL